MSTDDNHYFSSLSVGERDAYDSAYSRVYGQSRSHYAADAAGRAAVIEHARKVRLQREANEARRRAVSS